MSHDEMPKLLQHADVVVVPSIYEPFGVIVAESLACGTPVIISDMVGAKDLVTNGSAIVFRANHSSDLAKAITKMWRTKNDPNLPFYIRESVRERINSESVADHILEALLSLKLKKCSLIDVER